MHKIYIVVALACSTALAGCMDQSAKGAFTDARVQLGTAKAGFTPKRDSLALLRYAAANAKKTEDKIKYNSFLAKTLDDRGFKKESLEAFERAALAGDVNSASHVAKGQLDGTYRPKDLAAIAPLYLQLATSGDNQSVLLLLSELTAQGKLKGPEYKSSTYWLQQAAKQGNKRAIGELAKAAEARGDIAGAERLYRRLDNGLAPGERALRQARDNYLGMDRPKNPGFGHKWLVLAAAENKQAAAQLAARIYRETNAEVDTAYLEEVAAAGGIQNLQISTFGRSKVIEGYRAAKTDAERDAILEPIRKVADKGNVSTSFFFAGILQNVGRPADALKYYLVAIKGGVKEAVQPVTDIVTIMNESDPATKSAIEALEAVGNSGNLQAAKVLGTLYGVGGPVKTDVDKSLKWLKAAADLGDPDSQYRFGVLSIDRAKTDADKAAARTYIQKAADAGNAGAKAYLASSAN